MLRYKAEFRGMIRRTLKVVACMGTKALDAGWFAAEAFAVAMCPVSTKRLPNRFLECRSACLVIHSSLPTGITMA